MSVSTEQVTTFLQVHGDFNVYGTIQNVMVFNGANALNSLKLWYWIKCFDPNRGFTWSANSHTKQIMTALVKDDHTGTTFGCLMRVLQRMAKEYIEDDGEDIKCTVCQNDKYDVGTKTTLECGHVFHCECIRGWYETSLAKGCCPNCRLETLPNYDERT
jgi:hypothetical protein